MTYTQLLHNYVSCFLVFIYFTLTNISWVKFLLWNGKGFYGQEPPSLGSSTTECGVNYQLFAVIYWCSTIGNDPSCSRPQPATDNGIRDGRITWLVSPLPSWAVPPERLVNSINLCRLSRESTLQPSTCEATTLPMTLGYETEMYVWNWVVRMKLSCAYETEFKL